ncbi:MAG: L-rhamnose mutarotase [Kiritimatiellia bacterium]
MIRKAFVMSVNPDQLVEYEKRHNPIWPDLEAVLKAHGVRSYTIFLHPGTHQLFGYVEFENEAQWNAIANTEPCRRWWAHMKDIMPSNPDNSPRSEEIREVFHLES